MQFLKHYECLQSDIGACLMHQDVLKAKIFRKGEKGRGGMIWTTVFTKT